ncbi:hypothetical protein BV22DRAFT_1165729 [Leucogyrophana mollusca]|uniref:Uncharacterized protein n=1 Tax=Leucogyrophana mollusca TaxID=85980 RepID=A0ACB8BF09_9AGAM|nr:hypothetical protein BV22DRAFT_1165729 [Leucogyrophana mollusca]
MVEIAKPPSPAQSSSPHPHPPSTPPPQTSSSYFVSAQDVLEKLRTAPNGTYAATPNLASTAEYFQGGREGDVLVSKLGETHEEYLLRGVFDISRNDFYFVPDGNFNPANSFQGKFEDVKLSCRLTASHHKDFKFSREDFHAIVKNIHALENLIPKEKNEEVKSIIQPSAAGDTIRLSHSLFKKKTHTAEDGDNDQDSVSSDALTDPSLGPDFEMSTWPVATNCKSVLNELATSHVIQPLPAWDVCHDLIPPRDYQQKLMGATVEVHMALVHHFIKSKKSHVFTLYLREMIVRRKPANLPTSPFKRRRLGTGPASEKLVKSKGKEKEKETK